MKFFQLMATAFLFFSVDAYSQFMLSITNGFRNDIQKVVEDYPNGFAALRGEIKAKNPQTTEYVSLLKPNAAEESSIVKYSANHKAIYSWQAILLTTENFEEAVKKYKWLFYQVKGMNIKYVADQYTLEGKYEEPVETLKFTTSVLSVAFPPSRFQKLKIEVSMHFEFPVWKVGLSIYEKEREDHERGDISEQ